MAPHIDGRLNWERLGKHGPGVVFVHPNPMDLTCWLYQMAHFSTWFRCIGIDLPGYGRSPKAQPGLSMQDLAQACWEATDEAGQDTAILVGCSVGSGVVEYMAYRRPERTLAVIVTGASYASPRTNTARRIAEYSAQGVAYRYQHTFEDYSPAFAGTELARYFATMFVERNAWADAPSIVELFRARHQPVPEEVHAGIKAPTLIITGSEDNAHPGAFTLQRRIPGAELVTMEGAGHACYMERPWEWDTHALRFLARHGLLDQTK